MGVDSVVPFGVQVAIGRVVFPGSEELENKGVTPDQFCLPTPEDLREHRDRCLGMARVALMKAMGKSLEKRDDKPLSPGVN
jgi:hypothetical protein